MAHVKAAVTGNRVDSVDPEKPKLSDSIATIIASWRAQLRSSAPATALDRYREAGIGVAVRESAGFPAALAHDIEAPVVVFHKGTLDCIAGTRVGVVGTRSCTRYGKDVAFELGRQLSRAGVGVVSGLATGIDAAAHRGAMDGIGPPIAVVGSGLDVVYPRANRRLWDDVVERGVVLSEAPLGAPPQAWRFPARNRIIAALSDVLVVVESHEHGGSLITVKEQTKRQRPTMAVPGPILSPASKGTNTLISEGCAPVLDIDDVLVAVGMSVPRRRTARETRPAPDDVGQSVLDAVGWQPATFDQLILRTELSVGALAVALDDLVRQRWLDQRGTWYERVSRDRVG
jgi:DNA processing protein